MSAALDPVAMHAAARGAPRRAPAGPGAPSAAGQGGTTRAPRRSVPIGTRPGAALDWPALIRAGLQHLRLKPSEFWALTPAELSLLLGLDRGLPAMGRARFLALSQQFPDRSTT